MCESNFCFILFDGICRQNYTNKTNKKKCKSSVLQDVYDVCVSIDTIIITPKDFRRMSWSFVDANVQLHLPFKGRGKGKKRAC